MRTFGKIILRIFDGIAKILAFLLVSCGLWLPALFCAAFFIGCAATGTRFGGGISALFWCGLGFTAMLGIGLAVFFRSKRKQKANANAAAQSAPVAEKTRKRDRKRNKKEENVATQAQPAQPVPPPYPYGGYDPYRNAYANPYTQGGYPPPAYPYPPQGQSYAPDNAGTPPVYANTAPPRAENDRRDLDRKYFGGDAPRAATAQPDPTPAHYERTASYDHDVTPLSYGKTMTKTQDIASD
ncbi:MAG: hypothetical protein K2L51_05930 [Clostridiales bacterium]|nr:hypothetical protein [Clostridiales bacterium]